MKFREFLYNFRRDLRDDLRDLKERRLKFDDYAALAVFAITNIHVWFFIYPQCLRCFQ